MEFESVKVKQPEALRLADALECGAEPDLNEVEKAAAELRRLHEVVDALQIVVATFNSRLDAQQTAIQNALENWEIYFDAYPHMQRGYVIDAITTLREQLKGSL